MHSSLYQTQIEKDLKQKPGKLIINWQSQQTHDFLMQNESKVEFELSAGTEILEIWFQAKGKDRIHPVDNGTLGDVTLKQVD